MSATPAPLHDAGDLEGAAKQWQDEGWVIVDRLLPADVVSDALAELQASGRTELAGPIRRPELLARRRRSEANSDEVAFRAPQFDGTTLFPIDDCPTLNRLFVDEALLRFAQLALDSKDLRIYQSRVWSKQGDHTDYEQPMHRDGNHSLIPISNVPEWWHLELFVYLQDVDEHNGATGVVPGSVARASLTDRASLDKAQAPELYEAEMLASAPAGSVLAYRSDVWHRGHNLAPGTDRHIMVVSYKPATATFVGFDEHAPLVNHPDWVRFAEQCTPDQLALFGVPRPGHRYWTTELIDAMAGIYPDLDLAPWREQL